MILPFEITNEVHKVRCPKCMKCFFNKVLLINDPEKINKFTGRKFVSFPQIIGVKRFIYLCPNCFSLVIKHENQRFKTIFKYTDHPNYLRLKILINHYCVVKK